MSIIIFKLKQYLLEQDKMNSVDNFFKKVQYNIFHKVFKVANPRNEREYDDIIGNVIKDVIKDDIKDIQELKWKEYSIWAFGSDATECCVCDDIPEHYIQCHTCEKIICNDCFVNDVLRGDSFYMIITTDIKGQLGAYYCNNCYTNMLVINNNLSYIYK